MIFIYFVCIVKRYTKCTFRFLSTIRQHSTNHLDLMRANTPISPSPNDHAHVLRRTPKHTQHHARRQQRNRDCSVQNTRQQHPGNFNSSNRPQPPPKYANPLWGRGQACSQLPKEQPNRKTQHHTRNCSARNTWRQSHSITSSKQQFLPELFARIRDTLTTGCLRMRPTVLRRTPKSPREPSPSKQTKNSAPVRASRKANIES